MALSLSAGAAGAGAQSPGPVSLDPDNARIGTALVLGLDGPAAPLTIRLPRGVGFDRAAAPRGARIGFGRYVVNVAGFLPPAGSTQLVWSLTAALGAPVSRGDLASVAITATLLGAGTVAALVQPVFGAPIPATSTLTARFVRAGGRVELRIPSLPAALAPTAPVTATPARLELSLSAVRRVRETFYHRVRVPTGSGGFRIQRIRDHRLVGHDLLTTPRSCPGSWSYTLSAGGRATVAAMPCAAALAFG